MGCLCLPAQNIQLGFSSVDSWVLPAQFRLKLRFLAGHELGQWVWPLQILRARSFLLGFAGVLRPGYERQKGQADERKSYKS
jgi:hypothetical protein